MKKVIITLAILATTTFAHAQTTYFVRDTTAQYPEFQSRVKIAAIQAASTKLSGAPALRVRQYAQIVISDASGASWLEALTYGVLTVSNIKITSSDAELLSAVNSIFDRYAYAYYKELPENN